MSAQNIISNSGTTTTIGDYGCSVVVRGNISFVEDRPIHMEDIYQSIGDGIPVNYPMQNKYFQNLNPLIIFS